MHCRSTHPHHDRKPHARRNPRPVRWCLRGGSCCFALCATGGPICPTGGAAARQLCGCRRCRPGQGPTGRRWGERGRGRQKGHTGSFSASANTVNGQGMVCPSASGRRRGSRHWAWLQKRFKMVAQCARLQPRPSQQTTTHQTPTPRIPPNSRTCTSTKQLPLQCIEPPLLAH